MKIMYYTWQENSYADAVKVLRDMGHKLVIADKHCKDYHDDDELYDYLMKLGKEDCDCIFSFDYFPIVSNVAQELQIPYVSWVYDCPHLTLYSKSVLNPVNRIYVFDRVQEQELKDIGCQYVYHQPLAAATERLNSQLGNLSMAYDDYAYDVSFVGSLYDHSPYDTIKYLPPYVKGYLDGVINAQQKVQGYNFADNILPDEVVSEFLKYVKFDFGEHFYPVERYVISDMVNRKITSNERIRLLNMVADKYKLTLFSGSPKDYVNNASFGGYVDYTSQMPDAFRRSKINLNITLRSITSGIPLRAIDIMAAGGFLISNYQPELEELFVNNEECVMYYSEDELMYFIDYYLHNDEERRRIAYNGYKKVNELYSYETVLNNMLTDIN